MNETTLSRPIDSTIPLGLAAFDSLRAEDEPWLGQCYVPPPGFPFMAGWRSALIFGDVGSGKTALRLALEHRWCPPGSKPSLLLVRWPMTLAATTGLAGTALVEEQHRHVLDAVARTLVQHLIHYPADWGLAPAWAHDTLIWFVHRHLRGDLTHHLASLEAEASTEGVALLQSIATASVREVLYPGAPPPLIVAELIRALQRLGLEGVCVLVAGLQAWLIADPQSLANTLQTFLFTLALFEHPHFAYKMLLPEELESPLWSAGSVVRRRVDTHSLKWDTPTLRIMVERRLALALGEKDFTLKQLGPIKRLLRWLEGCGGHSPRGWLETIRPFFATYLAKAEKRGKRTSLTAKQCLTVQKRHPPRLFMDMDTGRVTVGWREVIGLQLGQRALLEYLYQYRGQLCSREKLYRAYARALGEKVEDRLFPVDYAGRLDNVVYRVRQVIEPDPSNTVLVVTVKGKGYRLDNAW